MLQRHCKDYISSLYAFEGRRGEYKCVKCPRSEYPTQCDFLAYLNSQVPDHWKGEGQDHEVNQ